MEVECMACGKKITIQKGQNRVECPKCDTIMRWKNVENMILTK